MASTPSNAGGFIADLVSAKGVAASALAMGGAYGILGLGMTDALQFGAVTALGVSLGDTALTMGGIGSKIESYMTHDPWGSYLDPNDFLGGGVGTGALAYVIGFQGRSLAIAAGIGAVAGGVAPKLAGYIVTKLTTATAPPA